MIDTNTRTANGPGGSRRTRTLTAAVGLALTAVMVAAAAPAQATATHASRAGATTVVVRPATATIGDDKHGFLLFINKSRADLCTPERITFEIAFEAWLDNPVGAPPDEPASSQQGVRPVTFTHTPLLNDGSHDTVDGENLPVEVWRFDNETAGLDCTATDGPGAELFARGRMDWKSNFVGTANRVFSDTSVSGPVTGIDGTHYSYLVRYIYRQHGSSDGTLTPIIRLHRIR